MPALMAVANRHRLAVVEDCCQAHLATCEGRPVGSFGERPPTASIRRRTWGPSATAARSPPPTSIANACVACATADRRIAYRHQEFGVNSRLDEMQAAVLRARLAGCRSGRASGARSPRSTGGDSRTPRSRSHRVRSRSTCITLFPVLSSRSRGVQAHLRVAGRRDADSLSGAHSPSAGARRGEPGRVSGRRRIAAEILSLPLHPGLTRRRSTTSPSRSTSSTWPSDPLRCSMMIGVTVRASASSRRALAAAVCSALAYAMRPPLTLEMERDLPRNMSGLYPPEFVNGQTFAWTRRVKVSLPGLDRRVPWKCSVRFRGGRSALLLQPTVDIQVDGVTGSQAATNELRGSWRSRRRRQGRQGLTLINRRCRTPFVPGPSGPARAGRAGRSAGVSARGGEGWYCLRRCAIAGGHDGRRRARRRARR